MKTIDRIPSLFLLLGLLAPGSGLPAQTGAPRAEVSPVLPHYQPHFAVSGKLEVPFSDALTDLGGSWSQGFRKAQPAFQVVFKSQLSGEAAKTLVDGTAPMVILARQLTGDENQAFASAFHYSPSPIPVCLDATIIIVNKNNPITSISMEQLDAIYSRDRLGGAKAAAEVWGDLGVKGDLASRPINAYARGEGTATRAAFRDVALLGGAYQPGVIAVDDAPGLAEAVSMDPAGIAFGTMSSWFDTNKTLPVVPYKGTGAHLPTQQEVAAGTYPMPRVFYAYVNRAAKGPVVQVANELLRYLLSQEGQGAIADAGLLPGPAAPILKVLQAN